MDIGDLPASTIINDAKAQLTWARADFEREIDRRVVQLASLGLGPKTIVVIAHGGSAHFFADLFAVWAIGAIPACLDGTTPPAEIEKLAAFADAPLVLTSGRMTLPNGAVPALDLRDASPARSENARVRVRFNAEDPALILFTSGTTGLPKGVVISHGALKERLRLNEVAIDRETLRSTLLTLPTHFGHGLIGNSLTPLASGGVLHIYPLGLELARNLGAVVDRHAISFLTSVPAFWRMVLADGKLPGRASLRRVHVGSAPVSAQLWRAIADWSDAEVVNCYGMTETANWFGGQSSRDGIEDGLVGVPWGGSVAILDREGAISSFGEGEIVVRTPTVMTGYLGRSDLTAATFKDGWYRTGDIGNVDGAGRIRLMGRIKDEINRAGLKVHPAEIDHLLERHPAVAEACVFGLPDAVSGEIVAAAVRMKPGSAETWATLATYCAAFLPPAAIPEKWFCVEDIPRTARGKVSRALVRDTLANNEPATIPAAVAIAVPIPGREPQSRLEELSGRIRQVVELAWTRNFGHRAFEADVDWDEAGGSSLGIMRLWMTIADELGIQPPFERFVQNLTPSRLIGFLESEGCGQLDVGGSVKAEPDLPTVVFLPHAYGDAPLLVRFRKAFVGSLNFVSISYPDAEDLARVGNSSAFLVTSIADRIVSACGDTEIAIVGYSFGGLIAVEVARALFARGRALRFVGILDTQLKRSANLSSGTRNTSAATTKQLIPSLKGAYYSAIWWLAEACVRVGTPNVLIGMLKAGRILPASGGAEFRLQVDAKLRTRAMRDCQPGRLYFPATLFRSDEFDPEIPDHGWSAVCDQLTVVPVAGDHRSMLEPGHCDLSTHVRRAFNSAHLAE